LDINDALKTIAVLSAVAVPAGYAYSMLRYNLLIDGLLWRPGLVRVAYSSILIFAFTALLLFVWPAGSDLPGSEALVAWLGIVLAVVVLASVQERLGRWADRRLFKGGRYVEFLASATDELQRFHSLDQYVRFFTERLSTRIDITGSLVFLAPGPLDALVLRGHSPTLGPRVQLHDTPALLPESELRTTLASAATPIALSTLLVPRDVPFPDQDTRLLEVLRAAGMELLLPLVSSQRELIGLVVLGGKITDEAFSTEELSALSTLARAASIAAENVLRLEELEQERRYSAELARSVSATQEAERKRISRDLHDSTLQDLGVISRALTQMREQVQNMVVDLEEQQLEIETKPHRKVVDGYCCPPTHDEVANLLSNWHDKLEVLLGEDDRDLELLGGAIYNGISGSGNLMDASLVGFAGRPSIEGLVAQTRATSQRARAICNELHPTYLDVPLVAALKESIAHFQTQYSKVCITLHVTGDEPPGLADEIKVACKQVMEQAIRNALQHGSPSRVTMRVSFSADGLTTLTIEDDGLGFEPRPFKAFRVAGHHGLANMRERAELVNGELHVDSAVGKGTCVELVVGSRTEDVA
ncbi:MAG: ATP-binding protein, partial [Chloroflexota bacterium]|nr:ATP-binding protein [Chloroflexota bacterium]